MSHCRFSVCYRMNKNGLWFVQYSPFFGNRCYITRFTSNYRIFGGMCEVNVATCWCESRCKLIRCNKRLSTHIPPLLTRASVFGVILPCNKQAMCDSSCSALISCLPMKLSGGKKKCHFFSVRLTLKQALLFWSFFLEPEMPIGMFLISPWYSFHMAIWKNRLLTICGKEWPSGNVGGNWKLLYTFI